MPATTAFYRAKRIRGALHLLPRKNPRTSLSRSRIHRLDGQQYLKGLFLQRLVVLPRIPRSAAASQSFRIARPLRTLYTVEDMRRALLVLTCLSLGLLPGCAMHRSVKKSLAEKRVRETEARTAAEEWLALIDAANYPAAYALELARLRAAATEEQFVRSMEGRRQPFGRVLSRKFIGSAYTRKLTGAPDGYYESILFRTSFAHKSVAAERVILSRENDGWRVVDYRVY
jgi:hypothetical protein